jgi:hypothetical protein
MNIAKNILIKESPPILQLFCFIYAEIKKELEESENISDRAVELAEQFKENYLQPDSSLFGKDTFAETVNILRETLEDIDTKTTYKDEEYWHFFEAVEAFLYGERQEDNEGIYWGFSSFYDIWEDMCQTYVLNTPGYRTKAIFADVEGRLKELILEHPINPFQLKLNNLTRLRYLRPDLVLKEKGNQIENFDEATPIVLTSGETVFRINIKSSNLLNIKKKYPEIFDKYMELSKLEHNKQTGDSGSRSNRYMIKENLECFQQLLKQTFCSLSFSFKIIDYKYMRISDYERYSPNYMDKNGENKVKEDIHKQLVYEWTVQNNWRVKTESEFWIPYYPNDPLEFEKIYPVRNGHFNQSKIKLVKINFKTLQDFYIKQALV